MEKTPLSMRKHIAIAGETNAGKSSLFNLLLGQENAIVSPVRGTTTDPVIKAMELIPYGPVALMDTAGLGDSTELGQERMKKTLEALSRADLILYVIEAGGAEKIHDLQSKAPVILVYTKCECLSSEELAHLRENKLSAVFLSDFGRQGMEELKTRIIEELRKQERDDETLIGDLLPAGSNVVMVVPIDDAAPKGRLILPQVQLIRDCLDHDMMVHVTKKTTLTEMLSQLERVDLVVTDSQAFQLVDRLVPQEIPLTSFSMLLARQKGNFAQYIEGARGFLKLKNGSRVLVMEGCSHNKTHEDIGRVKIPNLIQKRTGAVCEYVFLSGYQFPEDLDGFDLALSCGMCMINKQEVQSRLMRLAEAGIPVVNYGIALAWLTGILDRAKEIFERN